MQFKLIDNAPETVRLKDEEKVLIKEVASVNLGSALKIFDIEQSFKYIRRVRTLLKKLFKFRKFRFRNVEDGILVVRIK